MICGLEMTGEEADFTSVKMLFLYMSRKTGEEC
jgi:hypothetical protein